MLNTFVAIKLSADLYKATNQTPNLYGADVLVSYDLLTELLKYETKVHGLNLTHSQDKDYIYVSNNLLKEIIDQIDSLQDIVNSVSVILDSKYGDHWRRIKELTEGSAEELIAAIEVYINILSESQHDTYTNPFEIVLPNTGNFFLFAIFNSNLVDQLIIV